MDLTPFEDFTNDEKERINQLYGSDFEGITPDDAQLIARWEQAKTLVNAEYQAKQEALQEETQLRQAQSVELFEHAKANLQELHDIAIRRLEAFNDGI